MRLKIFFKNEKMQKKIIIINKIFKNCTYIKVKSYDVRKTLEERNYQNAYKLLDGRKKLRNVKARRKGEEKNHVDRLFRSSHHGETLNSTLSGSKMLGNCYGL